MPSNPFRFAIIAAEYNKDIVEPMIDAARAELSSAGAIVDGITRVPGAYEIPLIADLQMARPEIDAVVVLGYIERGETLHGEVMGHVVHAALVRLQLKHRKPAGLGIVGPGATVEQAHVRKINSARAAVRAALCNARIIEDAKPISF